ncbi:MAG: DUF373 family protein [Nitrososphaerales archaeon]
MSISIKGRGLNKLVVVCVDRDDDVGSKAKLKTPILGKENCLLAASSLALADPEEADANTIFAAVRECEDLKNKGYICDVAVIAGKPERGMEADEKVRDELKKVVELSKADGLVLVSDGYDDEQVIPVIQSLAPIISVRRVVIKHSGRIEESYQVLGRYLRMFISEPRYAKYSLGIPGLILFLLGVLNYLGLIREALTLTLTLLGIVFIIRGFNIDKLVGSLKSLSPSSYLRLFTLVTSILIILTSLLLGFTEIPKELLDKLSENPYNILSVGPSLLGYFLQGAVNFLWIGLGINLIGSFLYHWLKKSLRILRDLVGIVILALLYLPVTQFSLILAGQGSALTLFFYILLGLALTFLVVVLAYEYIIAKRRVKVD